VFLVFNEGIRGTAMSLRPIFWALLMVLHASGIASRGQGRCLGQDEPGHPLPVALQVVEAACGECQFGMAGESCDLAIRIDGSTFFVDGTSIDDHGDAHAESGLCQCVRKALVSGHVADGRFVADQFRLIAAPGTEVTISNEDAFERVWSIVNERFYRGDFNGVDWTHARAEFLPRARGATDRRELSATINQMLGLLHTSHTHFYIRDDVEFYHLADIFSAGPLRLDVLPHFPDGRVTYTGIGVMTRRVEDRWFISGVWEGSPAAQAGLRRGEQIVSIDGRPFAPIGSFAGKAGTVVAVETQTGPDERSRRTVAVTPIEIAPQACLLDAMRASMRVINSGGKRIGYVRIWSYAGQPFQDALVDAVAGDPFSSADALIVDLRDGWGGADPEYLQLFNRDIPVIASVDRDGKSATFNSHWRKPAALLVNEGTRSGKELIAYAFRKAKLGPVIGTRTAGAVSAGTLVPIGSDGLLYVAARGVEVDGEVLEGRGVEPDHVVPWDLPFASQIDPQLDAALEILSR
jgi:carboxyl-terminal processing protease